MPVFGFFISLIVFLSASKNVVRAATWRIIACVQKEKTGVRVSVSQKVSDLVRSFAFSVPVRAPVSATVKTSSPDPAAIRFFNLIPEMFRCSFKGPPTFPAAMVRFVSFKSRGLTEHLFPAHFTNTIGFSNFIRRQAVVFHMLIDGLFRAVATGRIVRDCPNCFTNNSLSQHGV